MSSSKQDHSENGRGPNIDVSDIANSESFMDALVAFLNEAYVCMQEVRIRAGVSPGCGTSVSMNDEEKEDRLKIILSSMSEKCQKEISQRPAQPIAPPQPIIGNFPPQEDECFCPTDLPISSSTRYPRGKRAEAPRSGASSFRNKVSIPDQYYMPETQSSMSSSPADYSQMGACPTYTMMTRSRTARGASSRSGSPQSHMAASSSYGGSGCPPTCSQAGGRQYRR